MSAPRTAASISVGATPPTSVFTGAVTAVVSFNITNNIATIVLGAGNLPTNGYNGANGYPGLSGTPDFHGGINSSASPAGGQQVTLWGFTTATYFNGKTVTVLDCNPVNGSFRFYFTHANVASTADTGNTAPIPVERHRAVRLEADQGNTTHSIYVGDLNVSSTRYIAALTLAGQLAMEISGDNIPADRIMVDTDSTGSKVKISLIY